MNLLFSLLETISYWLDPWYWFAVAFAIFILSWIGTGPIHEDDESTPFEMGLVKVRRIALAILAFLFLILPVAVILLAVAVARGEWYQIFNGFLFTAYDSFKVFWTAPLAGLLAGFFIRILWHRYMLPMRSRLLRRIRVRQSGESLSDIRTEKQRLQTKEFDPLKYLKDGYLVYGQDEAGKPIYVSEDDWKVHNQKIIGPTQTGKGVHIGCQLYQSIVKGHCSVFVDPKGDKHAIHIMNQACKASGRKLVVLDLSAEDPTLTWEPFSNGTHRERRTRLHYAFGLKDTGEQADFYKAAEREVIDSVFSKWNGTIKGLHKLLSKGHLAENAKRTLSNLGEWLYLPAFLKSNNNLVLDEFISSGGVLYVRSSLQDETVIKGTTIFLMDLAQTTMRLYNEKRRPNHVFAVVDEVRFLMTDLLADSLATICGFDAHLAIAYQSILDLQNLKDKNINARAVEQSVSINCKQTICYMADDTETAEWASDKTGEIQKAVTRMEGIETNELGGEVWEKRRLLNREAENYIPANVFRMLPERTGVFFFPAELAKVLYTCWVTVTEKYEPETRVIPTTETEPQKGHSADPSGKPKKDPETNTSEMPPAPPMPEDEPASFDELEEL